MINKLKYGIIAIVIGFIAGYVVVAGTLNYSTTKGQRVDFTNDITLIGGILGAVAGLIFVLTINNQMDVEKSFGFHNVKDGMFKDGRKWIALSTWIDPRTLQKYELMTGIGYSGMLMTSLNNINIHNHRIASGSKVNVEKAHKYAKTNVFNMIKANQNVTNVQELFKEV